RLQICEQVERASVQQEIRGRVSLELLDRAPELLHPVLQRGRVTELVALLLEQMVGLVHDPVARELLGEVSHERRLPGPVRPTHADAHVPPPLPRGAIVRPPRGAQLANGRMQPLMVPFVRWGRPSSSDTSAMTSGVKK